MPAVHPLSPPIAVRPGRSVLVAATGGHLAQLIRLSERIDLLAEPLWVTFDSPQSRSALDGREVEYVPMVRPRGALRVLTTVPRAREILRRHQAVEVFSTGSAVALGFLPVAAAMGIPAHYIESAARSKGPSVTGRALRLTPNVRTYTQYPEWARGGWRFAGSMFDEFRPAPGPMVTGPLKVFVQLGTLEFRFDALVDSLRRILPADAEVTWQVGPNDYHGLPGTVWSTVPQDKIQQACRDADVVVAHAGVGSALNALGAGKHAVLVARDKRRGEHVDAHQGYVADELARLGLATRVSPHELSYEILQDAANRRVERAGSAAQLRLQR